MLTFTSSAWEYAELTLMIEIFPSESRFTPKNYPRVQVPLAVKPALDAPQMAVRSVIDGLGHVGGGVSIKVSNFFTNAVRQAETVEYGGPGRLSDSLIKRIWRLGDLVNGWLQSDLRTSMSVNLSGAECLALMACWHARIGPMHALVPNARDWFNANSLRYGIQNVNDVEFARLITSLARLDAIEFQDEWIRPRETIVFVRV